jgi:hypothetical protein
MLGTGRRRIGQYGRVFERNTGIYWTLLGDEDLSRDSRPSGAKAFLKRRLVAIGQTFMLSPIARRLLTWLMQALELSQV